MKDFLIKIKAIFEGGDSLTKAEGGIGRLSDRLEECAKAGGIFGGAVAGVVSAAANLAISVGQQAVQSIGELVKGFARGVVGAADFAGNMSDLAAQTGQTVRDVVILNQVFKNAGLGGEAVGQSLNLLQKALTGVNEEGLPTAGVFARLGLSIDALKGMSAADALAAIGEKIAGLKTPADQTRAAMEMFGRSGGAMLAVLKDSSAFSTARTMVGGLAESISTSAQELDAFSDSIGGLDTKRMQFFAGFAQGLAGDLGTAATQINAMDLSKLGRDAGDVTSALLDMVAGLREVSEGLEELGKKVPGGGVVKWMMGNLSGENAANFVGGWVDKVRQIGTAKREAEELRKSTEASIAAGSEKKRRVSEEDPAISAAARGQELLVDAQDKMRKQDRDAAMKPEEKLRLLRVQKSVDEGLLERGEGSGDLTPEQTAQHLPAIQKEILALEKQITAEKERQEKQERADGQSRVDALSKKASDDFNAAAKREELNLELQLMEAKAAGNTAEEKRLKWRQDYNKALKEAAALGDMAHYYAKTKADEGGDPSADAKEPFVGVGVSSLAARGGSVGESLAAAKADALARTQEAAIAATKAATLATKALTDTMKKPLKVTATYQ